MNEAKVYSQKQGKQPSTEIFIAELEIFIAVVSSWKLIGLKNEESERFVDPRIYVRTVSSKVCVPSIWMGLNVEHLEMYPSCLKPCTANCSEDKVNFCT